MANDLNRCEFIGRLGADPEIRAMPSGDKVANVRIAVGSTWKDKSGEKRESTEWVPVVFFGKLAEVVERYLAKGSRIYVAGRFKTRKWQTQDGQDRYTTEVVVDMGGTMQMLDSRQGGNQGASGGQGGSGDAHSASYAAQAPSGGGFDDDIPFEVYQRGWVV
ncbi:MAG: single-stranded DNA-binding protein [Chromatiales bacterium]|nr:single-stranded DNA-binding protein [Chromatiales bacterium]MCK7581170.1 single-stranded DNA-binding protein [Chromatiales bacterium]